MSAPSQAKLIEIRAESLDDIFDDLTSALRRGDRDRALALLGERMPPHSGHRRPDRIRLSIWLQDECRLHVEGGRFQHALALVERYATLPVPLNKSDATALARRLGQ